MSATAKETLMRISVVGVAIRVVTATTLYNSVEHVVVCTSTSAVVLLLVDLPDIHGAVKILVLATVLVVLDALGVVQIGRQGLVQRFTFHAIYGK